MARDYEVYWIPWYNHPTKKKIETNANIKKIVEGKVSEKYTEAIAYQLTLFLSNFGKKLNKEKRTNQLLGLLSDFTDEEKIDLLKDMNLFISSNSSIDKLRQNLCERFYYNLKDLFNLFIKINKSKKLKNIKNLIIGYIKKLEDFQMQYEVF